MPLAGWLLELLHPCAGDLAPVGVRAGQVNRLVDRDPKRKLGALVAQRPQPAEKDFDDPRVTVDEGDALAAGIGLVLPALSSVERSADEQQSVSIDHSHVLGCRHLRSPATLLGRDAHHLTAELGQSGQPLLVRTGAEGRRLVTHPQRHGALGDTQLGLRSPARCVPAGAALGLAPAPRPSRAVVPSRPGVERPAPSGLPARLPRRARHRSAACSGRLRGGRRPARVTAGRLDAPWSECPLDVRQFGCR